MNTEDATLFWERYSVLTEKDFPVLLATGIVQSTLSSWRKHSRYPRADEAEKIAKALDTTVEYLVSGTDTRNSVCSSYGLDIAVLADKLNSEGFQILKSVAKGLIHDFGKNKESHD